MAIGPLTELSASTVGIGRPTLSPNGRKARFGASYVRLICNAAGYTFNETNVDEDVMAIDAEIPFKQASARVQIKCTGQFKINGLSATWPVESGWLEKWADSGVPVYFVLVKINDALEVGFEDSSTVLHAAAFWRRVDGLSEVAGIKLLRSQRLTVATVHEWADEVAAGYAPVRPREGT